MELNSTAHGRGRSSSPTDVPPHLLGEQRGPFREYSEHPVGSCVGLLDSDDAAERGASESARNGEDALRERQESGELVSVSMVLENLARELALLRSSSSDSPAQQGAAARGEREEASWTATACRSPALWCDQACCRATPLLVRYQKRSPKRTPGQSAEKKRTASACAHDRQATSIFKLNQFN